MTDRLSPSALDTEGRALVERLGGRWIGGKGGLCRCPAHDDRRPSLSIRIGRASLLVHCFAGCDTVRVLEALRALGHGVPRGGQPAPDAASAAACDGRTATAARAQARRLWREARSLEGTAAAQYLARRGLADESGELRYHPRVPRGARPFTVFEPALLAAVRDGEGLVAVHRTFLAPGGRGLAPIELPRMALGRLAAGAVRLGNPGTRLGLAEGIETALSATRLFGCPCWATLGVERFARVALPSELETLVLCLDHDAGGRRAEALARAAYGGLRIEVRYPDRLGEDWNDVLRREAGAPPGGERGRAR